MARRARSQSDQTPAVTRDALVAAALVVLDRDGLDGLSMRRVAAELGVQAASTRRGCSTCWPTLCSSGSSSMSPLTPTGVSRRA